MSEKEAGQVLTSDNAAEFYAQKLGLADASQVEAVEQTEPTQAEGQTSEPDGQDEAKSTEEKKPNPKLEKRFSDLTKQREDARKEAQQERDARQKLEQRLAVLESPPKPNVPVVDDYEPQPSQFADAFEYAKALTDYGIDKRVEQMKREEVEAKKAQEHQKVIDAWGEKVQKAKTRLPDFDEMLSSANNVMLHEDIHEAILESDVGAEIAYHLAENEELAKKISSMSPKAALRQIGKLEAQFEVKPESPKTETVVRSKAPAPISPIRGVSNTNDVPMTSAGEWHGTFQAWKEARRAGKVR